MVLNLCSRNRKNPKSNYIISFGFLEFFIESDKNVIILN